MSCEVTTTTVVTVTTTNALASSDAVATGGSESAKSNSNSMKASKGVADDSFSDFNYWRIPPAVIEDEY